MSSYSYEAVDAGGGRICGVLDVSDQDEALRRIKEMGLFPTKVLAADGRRPARPKPSARRASLNLSLPLVGGRVKPKALAVFTRQLATLIDAGMPLLRGLRTLREQEENPVLRRVLDDMSAAIEGGSSLSEAIAAHPRTFNQLYVNMVKAGEIGGALEITLRRLAEFLEKAQKIKGRVKAALYYPVTVMFAALVILFLLMVFVVPKFQAVFTGLLSNSDMPVFTQFVLNVSQAVKGHALLTLLAAAGIAVAFQGAIHTRVGRLWLDRFKLRAPVLGPVFRKAAISRFARTLGTLLGNGVPVLQALTIVKQTTGNVVVGNVVCHVHDSVKEGETIAAPLRASRVFPAMVAGMVDIGEQTGALPDMLMKIADGYDEEVDNAVSAMTSLLEPVMILFLAVVVGGIVVALLLPLIALMDRGIDPGGPMSDL